MMSGSVARNPKRFSTLNPPQPSRLANPIHLRIVGSFFEASAVLGFSMMKSAIGPLPHRRVKAYRNRPHSEMTALDLIVSSSIFEPPFIALWGMCCAGDPSGFIPSVRLPLASLPALLETFSHRPVGGGYFSAPDPRAAKRYDATSPLGCHRLHGLDRRRSYHLLSLKVCKAIDLKNRGRSARSLPPARLLPRPPLGVL